jgi:hypothetical protein
MKLNHIGFFGLVFLRTWIKKRFCSGWFGFPWIPGFYFLGFGLVFNRDIGSCCSINFWYKSIRRSEAVQLQFCFILDYSIYASSAIVHGLPQVQAP